MKSKLRKVQAASINQICYNLPGHLYWKDIDGVFMGCNKEQAAAFGLESPEDVFGKTSFDFTSKVGAENLTKIDMEVIESGVGIELEEFGEDGQWYLSKKVPLKGDDGQVSCLLGTSMNITKQKNLEKKLAEQNAQLTEALELKERVLRNVSHEIRTPVSNMVNIAEGILDLWDNLSDEDKRDNVTRIAKSQKGLVELVLNMLDISKLKSGTEELVLENNDIAKLARDIIDEFGKARIISLEIAPNVDTIVRCDRIKVLQVLRNLVGNAVRYSKVGSPIAVYVKQAKEQNAGICGLEISVTDQGVGIAEDELLAIFQPFYESKRTRQQSGGTGLGLSITREIVDAHGGKIRAQSNPVGTTFVFTIPRDIVRRAQLSQDTLRRLVDQVPGNIYLKDVAGKICASNLEHVRYMGCNSLRDSIGKTNWDVLSQEIAKATTAVDRRVFEEGELVEAEELGLNNQYYLSVKAPVKDAEGKVVGLFGNSLNITKIKNRELALEKENAELKQALEAREEALRRIDPTALAAMQKVG